MTNPNCYVCKHNYKPSGCEPRCNQMWCNGQNEFEPITQADHIRSMDDSKLEDFIRKIYLHYEPWCDRHCNNSEDANCNDCLRMWLKSPVEVESHG